MPPALAMVPPWPSSCPVRSSRPCVPAWLSVPLTLAMLPASIFSAAPLLASVPLLLSNRPLTRSSVDALPAELSVPPRLESSPASMCCAPLLAMVPASLASRPLTCNASVPLPVARSAPALLSRLSATISSCSAATLPPRRSNEPPCRDSARAAPMLPPWPDSICASMRRLPLAEIEPLRFSSCAARIADAASPAAINLPWSLTKRPACTSTAPLLPAFRRYCRAGCGPATGAPGCRARSDCRPR